jgi:L-threonylcarbamoyladenylate synthase
MYDKIVEILRRGGVILYPTDTVWGIGCDATNAAAVERVYGLKRSADKKSMLVLVRSVDAAAALTGRVPAVAWEMMELATSPLTLVLPGACGVAENLIPDEGTLGVRVPQDDFCQGLLRKFGRPLVSTSANISGRPAPLTFGEIGDEIKQGVDLVVDPSLESPAATHRPSAIVAFDAAGRIKIIREGRRPRPISKCVLPTSMRWVM